MGGRLAQIVAATTMLLVVAGCQLVPGGSSPGTATNQCTPDTVHQIVNRFIDAFNRGDLAQLDQLFAAPGKGFNWYATDAPGQRFNAEADNRDDLMAYFAARHAQHEHLLLNSLDVTYSNGTDAGFWFRLTRSADDGLRPTRYNGKGGIQCVFRPSSLTTWAMDPLPWSPVELLPEAAAALLLLVAAAVAVVVWRRRKRAAPYTIEIPRPPSRLESRDD